MRQFPMTTTTLVAAVALILALAAPASADSGSRPFKGFVAGQVMFNPVSLDVCPAGGLFWGGLRTESAATGTASHLGSTAMTARHCTPSGDAITGGEMTLVADNGDEVYIEYDGSGPFPGPGTVEIVVELDYQIVGGSGRFEGATGGGEMTAVVQFEGFEDPSWAAEWSWTGRIGY